MSYCVFTAAVILNMSWPLFLRCRIELLFLQSLFWKMTKSFEEFLLFLVRGEFHPPSLSAWQWLCLFPASTDAIKSSTSSIIWFIGPRNIVQFNWFLINVQHCQCEAWLLKSLKDTQKHLHFKQFPRKCFSIDVLVCGAPFNKKISLLFYS